MGKRKSKTSKQKQAKAAAKSLKSRVIKEPATITKQTMVTPGGKKRKGNKRDLSEKDDFQRQQASMQERLMAELQHEKWAKKKRGKNGAKASASFQFQAPTLIVDDHKKSTTQLMSEITSKAQGWDGISTGTSGMQQQQYQQQPSGTSISLKQVFESSSLQQQHEKRQQIKVNSKNRFAALYADDDDDEEEEDNTNASGEETTQEPIPKFQFAPATFQFAPASFSVSSGLKAEDVDPDL